MNNITIRQINKKLIEKHISWRNIARKHNEREEVTIVLVIIIIINNDCSNGKVYMLKSNQEQKHIRIE